MMSVKHNKHNLTDYVRRVGGWDERERQCVWGAREGSGGEASSRRGWALAPQASGDLPVQPHPALTPWFFFPPLYIQTHPSLQESGKLTKMWGVCDWFKGKKNHTKTYKEEAEEMDVAVAEKADEEFLMDFWHACSAWKKNKTWTWGYAKKNFTWFSKGNKEGELTAEIEN